MRTCFVVMGFGKKMDYQLGQMIDLDLVYKKVIKPIFADNRDLNYRVIRADEIYTSRLIDKEMYELLLDADLVIADITTLNANALYELGVRHALRPASTIIITQKAVDIPYPFDISHCHVFDYNDLENDLEGKNALAIREKLLKVIKSCDAGKTDSPVYTFLENLAPPQWMEPSTDSVKEKSAESKLLEIVKKIKSAKNAMKADDFKAATELWNELHMLLLHYPYIIQQLALATYKSKHPTEEKALKAGWKIINELPVDTTLDPETLGIAGAICKRMYILYTRSFFNRNEFDRLLKKAIQLYQKGFIITRNYYTGENYANCLLLKMQQDGLPDAEKTAVDYLRRSACQQIINHLSIDEDNRALDKWEAATMSNCYLHLQDEEAAEKYEQLFLQLNPDKWEQATFEETKGCIKQWLFWKKQMI